MSDKNNPIIWFGKCSDCGHVTPVRKFDKEVECSVYVSRRGYSGKCPGKLTRALDSCGCLVEHSDACKSYCGPD